MTKEKKLFLKNHLQHEFRLLFSSVQVWRLLKDMDAGFVVNIARDSSCVHFRTLMKFFVGSAENDVSVIEFDVTPLESDYKKWLGRMDEAILHISPERSTPKKPSDDSNDINDQMENFKSEILRLSEEFILKTPAEYKTIFMEELKRANKEASDDIEYLRKSLIKNNDKSN